MAEAEELKITFYKIYTIPKIVKPYPKNCLKGLLIQLYVSSSPIFNVVKVVVEIKFKSGT
ncbi:hypothetical protein ACVPOR_15040 [Staphylococcus aureus]